MLDFILQHRYALALADLLGTPIPLYFAILGFMLWILLSQQYTSPKKKAVTLSSSEVEEIINEWKPEPLGSCL